MRCCSAATSRSAASSTCRGRKPTRATGERAADANGRVVLAGRLAADNVREAIERVRPWAVDASSRLETAPGVKDHDAVRAFVEAAR